MSKYIDRAKELRKDIDRHYNCCQAVLIPFCDDLGISVEAAYKIASGFGSGMKSGKVCGAIVGGIMVLGLYGLDTPQNIAAIFDDVKANHEGLVDCKDLLTLNKEKGQDKANHCDNMVYQVIGAVERIMEL